MDFAAEADGMQPPASMRIEGNLAASPKRQASSAMKEQQVDAAISDLFSHGIALEEDPAGRRKRFRPTSGCSDLPDPRSCAHQSWYPVYQSA